jgi:hypothetical protein
LRGTECRSNPEINNECSGLLHSARNDASEIAINISSFPPGMYFIRIQTENGTVTKKVIKK